jgi:hypothetical protein
LSSADHLGHAALDELVLQRSDSEWALPPIGLWDKRSTRRFRAVRSSLKPFVESLDIFIKIRLVLLPRYPIDSRCRYTAQSHERCPEAFRCKFFEALPSAPKAKEMLTLILELYRIEAAAKENGLVRSPAHLALRQQKSGPILEHILQWLLEEQSRHPPRGALGMAIRYALAQWTALGHFVNDARLPLDNNASERALRVAALGRKNSLFVVSTTQKADLVQYLKSL